MLSKLRSLLVCTIAVLAAATTLAQNTTHVPADQPTIQAGINAANNGDTVLVAPGTYYENIDFKGKAITVTSSGGAAVTMIDGGAKGPTVSFKTSEPRTAVLSKFTIQHGGVFDYTLFANGGIYLNNSSPTILNNTITQNNCWTIYSNSAGPLIQGNEISATQDPNGDCSFGGGAGIYISGDFTNGFPTTSVDTPAYILGNTIEDNVDSGLEDAGGNGGAAIAVWGGSPVIENNILRNNASPGGSGGAINIQYGQGVVIAQNLIYGNSAGCGGGALAFMGGPNPVTGISVLIANNTIVDNTDKGFPAGFSECADISQIYPAPDSYGMSSPDVYIVNNILSGSTTYPAVNCGWFEIPSLSEQPTFEHNILRNTGGPFFGSYCIDVSGQDNNSTADPQFVNAAANDYHLKSSSPAIDAGDNSVIQTFLDMTGFSFAKDFDSNPRVQAAKSQNCIIDMGAYEYSGSVSQCSTTETLQSSLNPSTYGQSVTFTAQLSSSTGVPTGDVQFADGNTILEAETISSTGTSTYTTSTLAVGTHPITATYQPTGIFTAATASLSQVVTGTPTSTTLTCSATPIYIDAITLLSAMVSSSGGTPTGSITFTDGTTTLGQIQLTNGDANLTYTGTVVGSHIITATYVPTGSFAASSATCNLTVLALPTTSILTVTPTTSIFGSPVTLTATVSPVTKPGPSVPNGTVTFYNGATSLNTATLSAGVATYTTSTLPGGPNNLTCAYNGSSIYAPSNCNTIPATITAAVATLTLTSSANPSFAASPVTFTAQLTANGQPAPAGTSITITVAGQTFQLTTDTNGYASATAYTLVPGSYLVTATSAATPSLQSATASLTQIVIANPTTTTLNASPTPGELTQPVTLTATVTATTGTSNPTGIVKFYDGSTLLGTAATGTSTTTTTTATFLTSSLTLGQHSLTASYIPNTPSYLPSQSTTLPFTVISQEFTFTAAQNPMSLETRLTGTNILTLTSIGGFTAPITISCPPAMPPAATCSLSSHTVQLPANGTATTTLTITTEVTSGATFWTFLHPASSSSRRIVLASSFPLTLLMLMGLRRRRIRRNGLHIALTLASLAILTSTLSACAPGQTVSTYPGTYTVTLTASGTGQGSSTPTVHTLDLTLVVTPYVP
jgi:parallel beta-helix repeat protein